MPSMVELVSALCVLVLFALIVALPLCISASRGDEALREALREDQEADDGSVG